MGVSDNATNQRNWIGLWNTKNVPSNFSSSFTVKTPLEIKIKNASDNIS